MSELYSPLILLITSSAVAVVLIFLAWRRRRAPGAIPFLLLMLSVVEWSLAYALELRSPDLQGKIFWSSLKYIGIITLPVFYFCFVVQYTARKPWLTIPRVVVLSGVPFITLLLVLTNDLHGLIWNSVTLDTSGSIPVRISTRGAWFFVHTLYSYLLIFIGTLLIVRSIVRSPDLYRGQTTGLLLGVISPWVGNVLHISGLNPFLSLDPTPFAFTVSGLMFSWSMFGFHLLDIHPIARDTVIEKMTDMVIVMDTLDRIIDLNPAAQRALGCTSSEAIGQKAANIFSPWPDLVKRYQHATDESRSEILFERGKTQCYFDLSISPLLDKYRRPTGRLVVLRDITERKQAEEVLQKSHDHLEKRVIERTEALTAVNEQLKQEIEERARTEEALKESLTLIGRAKREWESTADSLGQFICLIDSQGHILRTNRVVERWNLGQVVNVKGKPVHELFHPNCKDSNCYLNNFWTGAFKELAHGRSATCETEDRSLQRFFHIHVRPISPQAYKEGEGTASYAVMIVDDITESKSTEKEITALEEQLRQSQKMEAIGRLTGGIAHDFNNLLTPIIGYTQLAMNMIPPSDPMKEDLQEIQKSAERASTLIRQMMTFSRRQPSKPQVLNVNNILLDMDKMLRRLIGKHIELVTLPSPDLGSVKVDPGQFEQVLVNLAVNARDAMPVGGKLIFETSNVTLNQEDVIQHTGLKPGPYVRLEVSDTGIGMTEEIKEHLFEPFFTTKEKGMGTGLGLATCYGIIKQSDGHILVYSEPEQGTTFKIYLPCVEEETHTLPRRDDVGYLPKGNETILLVEDEPAVRGFALRVLREQGYTVLQADNGVEAMRVAQEHGEDRIHLLLTDVVMPQMGGETLAHHLKTIRAEIKVLFTSGYTDNVVVQHGLLNPDIAFLEKPFSPFVLTRKVREVLDR